MAALQERFINLYGLEYLMLQDGNFVQLIINTARYDKYQTVEDVLNDCNVLVPVSPGEDTYKCMDCNVTLDGYRTNPRYGEHIRKDVSGTCRYLRVAFRGRERELLVFRAVQRFQDGYMAFPEFVPYSKKGYVIITGHQYCVVCASPYEEHHHTLCGAMKDKIENAFKNPKSVIRSETDLLYSQLTPDSQTSLSEYARDFRRLGNPGPMKYVPGTPDTHQCYSCNSKLEKFRVGDTLLGRHIFSVLSQRIRCPWLEEKFVLRSDELLLCYARERFKRGLVAFPHSLFCSTYGKCSFVGLLRCVVCSARVFSNKTPRGAEHYSACKNATENLVCSLKHFKFYCQETSL